MVFHRLLLIPLAFIIWVGSGFTPADAQPSRKLDPALQRALALIKTQNPRLSGLDARLPAGVTESGVGSSVGVLVKGGRIAEGAIVSLGGRVGSRHGSIITATIPLANVEKLAESADVEYVEASRILRSDLDLSMPKTGADVLHNQSNPAMQLTGKGVIIGFTDTGIETALPNFRTPDGRSRVLYIWDQYETGTPPSGYGYGAEHDSSQINNGTYSMSDGGEHGTHVSGIAAGNGRPDGMYIGMAPEADIIMVANRGDDLWSHGETTVGTLDGYDYIRAKATALGKRFVINTSQGTNMGPHDGTTLFEQAVNADVTAGAIICLSSGNEAMSQRHGSMTVPKTGTIDCNFHFLGDNSFSIPLDMWYESGDRIQIQIKKTSSGTFTTAVTPGSSQTFTFDSVTVDITSMTGSPLNGDNEIYLTFTPTVTIRSTLRMTLRLSAASGNALPDGGKVHMWWERNYQVAFLNRIDQTITLGMPGCADSAITVGSYNNREGYGAVDAISNFSGVGPRRDGVRKPDITGLGGRIISSLPSGWGEMSGTSMSSPHVAGAVALLLQQNPTWTNAQVRSALQQSAVSDGNTGTVPNSTWGYGKLNVIRATGYITPKPPTFSALTLNGTDATLTWTDPTQYTDNSPLTTLSEILVVRNDEVMASVSPGVQTYVDHNLTEGVYVYHLVARTSAGLASGNSANRSVLLFSRHNPILLVDDDAGASYQGYYTDALNACGRTYDYWETARYGTVPASVLNQYVSTSSGVIWFTGDDYLTPLDTSEQSALQTYLGNQGRLFITGQDIGYNLDATNATWMQTYLSATYVQDDVGLRGIKGAAGDILSGILCPISGGTGANNQGFPDEIDPVSPAVAILTYDASVGSSLRRAVQKSGAKTPPTTQGITSTGTAGVKYELGNRRVVYFAFGFEGIDAAASRNSVMDKVTEWLFGSLVRWSSTMTITDNCATNGQIEFGQAVGATDGLDSQYGEAALPAVPGSGVFDIRFLMRATPTVGSLHDFRSDNLHSLTWHLKFQGCGYPFTVSWETANLPQGTMLLSDEVNGSIVSVDMHAMSSCTVTDPSVTGLRIDWDRGVRAAPVVFLEGPYDTVAHEMKLGLHASGALTSHFTGHSIPVNAVDSVCIEIRNGIDSASSTIRKKQPAWLLKDGTIRSFADTIAPYVVYDSLSAGSFYVVVHHRNHLAAMSSAALALNVKEVPYDFTGEGSSAYGTNGTKRLAVGAFGMYAADANGSGDVSILDRGIWRTQNSLTGYREADFNLSGDVSILDRALWRFNNSLTTRVP